VLALKRFLRRWGAAAKRSALNKWNEANAVHFNTTRQCSTVFVELVAGCVKLKHMKRQREEQEAKDWAYYLKNGRYPHQKHTMLSTGLLRQSTGSKQQQKANASQSTSAAMSDEVFRKSLVEKRNTPTKAKHRSSSSRNEDGKGLKSSVSHSAERRRSRHLHVHYSSSEAKSSGYHSSSDDNGYGDGGSSSDAEPIPEKPIKPILTKASISALLN
jgi:hypothetical protein